MSVAVTPHLVLEYQLAPRYLERRAALRVEHLALLAQQDSLVLAGALDDASRALLVFRGDDPAAVEAFARADQYVVHGLVTAWDVRPWNVVAGSAR